MATVVDNRRRFKNTSGRDLMDTAFKLRSLAVQENLTGRQIASNEKIASERITSNEKLAKQGNKLSRKQIKVSAINAEAQSKLANIAVEKHNATKTVAEDIAESNRRAAVAKAAGMEAEAKELSARAKWLSGLDEKGINAYYMAGQQNSMMRSQLAEVQAQKAISDIQLMQKDLTIKSLDIQQQRMKTTDNVFNNLRGNLQFLNPELIPLYESRLNAVKQEYQEFGPASPNYQQLVQDMSADIKTSQETKRQQSVDEAVQKTRISVINDLFKNEDFLKGLSPEVQGQLKEAAINALGGPEVESEYGWRQRLGAPSVNIKDKADNRSADEILGQPEKSKKEKKKPLTPVRGNVGSVLDELSGLK